MKHNETRDPSQSSCYLQQMSKFLMFRNWSSHATVLTNESFYFYFANLA